MARVIVKAVERPHAKHDFQIFGTRASGAIVYYCIDGDKCKEYMVVCPNHGNEIDGGWWNVCILVANPATPNTYYCPDCKVTV